MSMTPGVTSEKSPGGVRLALAGGWTVDAGSQLEKSAKALLALASGARAAMIDLSRIDRMDTAGAWVIDRSRETLAANGVEARFVGERPEHAILLREAHFRPVEPPRPQESPSLSSLVADVGESVYIAGVDLIGGLGFLGRLVTIGAAVILHPARWRLTSTIFHLEAFALRSAPIILLINFLVGAIVAQQGIFQLARFGATPFAVDLIGILVLRELGVLLTSIMIAGRSGSAITAEIGAMKMREEIDALDGDGARSDRGADRAARAGADRRAAAPDVPGRYRGAVRRSVRPPGSMAASAPNVFLERLQRRDRRSASS